MKKAMFSGLVVLALLTVGCEQCYVCEYTNNNGERKSTSELCDDKQGLESLEKELNEQWGQYGEVVCSNSPK